MTLPHPCLDCGALSRGSRCPRCQSAREAARGSTTERGYGARWQRTSASVIARDGGVCQLRLAGCTVRATTTDHVIAKANGGTDDDANLITTCRPCNSKKRDR